MPVQSILEISVNIMVSKGATLQMQVLVLHVMTCLEVQVQKNCIKFTNIPEDVGYILCGRIFG